MTDLSRRRVLGYIGAGATVPVFARRVSAADSDPQLTLSGTIPSGTQIDVTVEEYDTQSSTSPVTSETQSFSSTGSSTTYSQLDAELEYYYLFDIDFTGDGSSTPELSALLMEFPYRNIDYTDSLEWRAKADKTIIEFDEQYLRNYQPMLRMSSDARQRHKGLYGYVARSEEHETDVLCYWSQLTHQDGLPGVNSDSHLGDHEPIFVFVNDDGSVDKIVYSAYHWFAGSATFGSGTTKLKANRASQPTHAVMSVVSPWHNYQFTPEKDGAFVELKSWPEVRSTWIKNGFYKPANAAAIEDPWRMESLDSWWQPNSVDAMVAGAWANVGRTLGWFGADEADSWR